MSQETVNIFIVTLVYSGFIAFPYIMHCIHLSHFFFRVIRFFSIVTLVYIVYIAFPYVMHLYTLVTLFFQNHQKIFVPRNGQFFHRHTCIQCLHSFTLCNAFVYTCHAFLVLHRKIFVPRNSHFFIVTLVYSGFIAFPYVMHLYTLVTLFSSIIRKYLPHAFCYAQLVSVCLTMMSHLKSWSYII